MKRRAGGVDVVFAEGFGGTGCTRIFAGEEQLTKGGQGGDGNADVLFEAEG